MSMAAARKSDPASPPQGGDDRKWRRRAAARPDELLDAALDEFITISTATGAGTLFNVIDAKSFDIEGCAFLEPDTNVGVQSSSWSDFKQLYKNP